MASQTRRKKSPILDMLSSEGQATRPLASQAAPSADSDAREAVAPEASTPPAVPVEVPEAISEGDETKPVTPARSSRPTRTSEPEPTEATQAGATPASATVRAKGHAVADLRQAWLEAKASDLMLSYTDYATRVIEEGLRSMRKAR